MNTLGVLDRYPKMFYEDGEVLLGIPYRQADNRPIFYDPCFQAMTRTSVQK